MVHTLETMKNMTSRKRTKAQFESSFSDEFYKDYPDANTGEIKTAFKNNIDWGRGNQLGGTPTDILKPANIGEALKGFQEREDKILKAKILPPPLSPPLSPQPPVVAPPITTSAHQQMVADQQKAQAERDAKKAAKLANQALLAQLVQQQQAPVVAQPQAPVVAQPKAPVVAQPKAPVVAPAKAQPKAPVVAQAKGLPPPPTVIPMANAVQIAKLKADDETYYPAKAKVPKLTKISNIADTTPKPAHIKQEAVNKMAGANEVLKKLDHQVQQHKVSLNYNKPNDLTDVLKRLGY